MDSRIGYLEDRIMEIRIANRQMKKMNTTYEIYGDNINVPTT